MERLGTQCPGQSTKGELTCELVEAHTIVFGGAHSHHLDIGQLRCGALKGSGALQGRVCQCLKVAPLGGLKEPELREP